VSLSAGVHSVLVTPFGSDESLDEASLRSLVGYYVRVIRPKHRGRETS